jgi:MoxR-like ATPase
MEEHQVTVDSTTYRLPAPFMVIATQNPVEHEGTYPLPESQLDRFLLRIRMGYPDRAAEIDMLDTHGAGSAVDELSPVLSPADVESMVEMTKAVHVAPALRDTSSTWRPPPAVTRLWSSACHPGPPWPCSERPGPTPPHGAAST